MSTITRPLFALLFAASLTFGIRTAFAQPASGGACKNEPPTFLGVCISEEDCDFRCIAEGGFDGTCMQRPDGACCICAL